jgi:hypothetical protein
MRDIVATIQAEQDEIIRLDHPEALVIEGARAPGRPWWRSPRHPVRSSKSAHWTYVAVDGPAGPDRRTAA